MKWFCKNYEKLSICMECGVAFKPFEGDFNHLCPTHRKEPLERANRMKMVMAWASIYWESLEPQSQKHYADMQAAYSLHVNSSMFAQGGQASGLAGMAMSQAGGLRGPGQAGDPLAFNFYDKGKINF